MQIDAFAGAGGFCLAWADEDGEALEAPRKIRVNVVSPPWVTETLIAFKMDTKGGKTAGEVANAYVKSVTGKESGATIAA